MPFIPQAFIVAPFKAPIPEISHSPKLDFERVSDENFSIMLSNSRT